MHRKLLDLPVIFERGKSMSLQERKLQVRQFLGACYPFDLGKSPTAHSEELESMELLDSEL